jgi:hypothetical protein
MSLEYRLIDFYGGEHYYALSYQKLREEHARLCALPDADFLRELPAALHLACIVSWLKELGAEATVGDHGIVHELVHQLHLGTETPLGTVRAQFAQVLRLA